MVNLDDLMQNNKQPANTGGQPQNTNQPQPNTQQTPPPTNQGENIPYPGSNQPPVNQNKSSNAVQNTQQQPQSVGNHSNQPQTNQQQPAANNPQPAANPQGGYVASQQQALHQSQGNAAGVHTPSQPNQYQQPQPQVNQQQPVENKPVQPTQPNIQSNSAGGQMYPEKTTSVNVNINTDQNKDSKPQKVNGFFRGLTLLSFLAVGVLMLLEAMGIMELSFGPVNGTYVYPIVMLLGTFVLFRYKSFFAKLFGIIFFLAFVVGIGAIVTLGALDKETKSPFQQDIVYPAIDDEVVQVDIHGFIGTYTLSGNNHIEILKGTYDADRNLKVYSGSTGDTGFFQVVESNQWNIFQKADSSIAASLSNAPMYDRLYIKNIIGYQDIDLSQLDWTKAKLHGGMGDVYLTIGDNIKKNNEVEITSLYSNITLNIPDGVGVDLYYKNLMGKAKFENMEEVADNHFKSPNFGSKPKRIKIVINTLSSNLDLNWIQ